MQLRKILSLIVLVSALAACQMPNKLPKTTNTQPNPTPALTYAQREDMLLGFDFLKLDASIDCHIKQEAQTITYSSGLELNSIHKQIRDRAFDFRRALKELQNTYFSKQTELAPVVISYVLKSIDGANSLTFSDDSLIVKIGDDVQAYKVKAEGTKTFNKVLNMIKNEFDQELIKKLQAALVE